MDPPGNLGSRGKCVHVIVVVKNVLIQSDAIAECCRVLYSRWLCLCAGVEMCILLLLLLHHCLQCLETVGWPSGRAMGL